MHFTRQSAFPTSTPKIFQPWDLQHLHLPEFFSETEHSRREQLYRTSCEQAQLIVVPSNWVKLDLMTHYGISEERIAIVNPPPPIAAYTPPTPAEEAQIAARFELPERFLFYPAQPWLHKNHDRLIAALADLRNEGVRIPLICSGRETERTSVLRELALELGVSEQVRFLGFVQPLELQVIFRRATGLIFPSLYEGWGFPVIEAFSAGLPVASSNVTSLPELADGAALLFNPLEGGEIAEAMLSLWSDERLRQALAERGRARAAEFDWHRTAILLRGHYRSVAGRELTHADRNVLAQASAV